MRIYVSDGGYWSAGIVPNVMEIEWNVEYPDKRTREDERKIITQFVKDLDFTGRISIVYGDECSECGAIVGEDLECLDCKKRNVIAGL